MSNTIKVNGIDVKNIYDFDDFDSVINKYVVALHEIDKNEIALPKFFKFKEIPHKFDSLTAYELDDVRDVIKGYELPDISRRDTILEIIKEFPKMQSKDVGILWLLSREYDKMSDGEFQKIYLEQKFKPYFLEISRQFFPTAFLIKKVLNTFLKVTLPNEISNIKKTISQEALIHKEFQRVSKVPKLSEFTSEKTFEETPLTLPNGESLYDIFNAMEVSVNIPFIFFATTVTHTNSSSASGEEIKTYYKIFDDIIPADNWITGEYEFPQIGSGFSSSISKECIFFYVLDSTEEKVMSADSINLPKLYSEGIWKSNNVIELSMTSAGISENGLTKVLESLRDRVDYVMGDTDQTGIKGVFSIKNTTFDPIVLADLIAINPYFGYFLFFDEKKKSVMMKKRFTFYYRIDQKGDVNSSITLTLTQNTEEKLIEVRVSRAENIYQIQQFMLIFSYLYGIYENERTSIAKIYESLYSGAVFKLSKKSSKKDENKKSRARLLALQSENNPNSDAFRGSFSEKCQSKEQPYLVPPEELDNVKALLKDKGGKSMEKHGLIEWPLKSGNIYACYPREDSEGDKNKYFWPGVYRSNPLEYDFERYQYKPCCFLVDQYEKKGSVLKEYIAGKGVKREKQSSNRPLGENKLAPPQRVAELPYYIQLVVNSSGYKRSSAIVDKKDVSPIVRYGVQLSPASFVHCLEQALNPKYVTSSDAKRDELTENTLKKAASLDNFSIAKQELFDARESSIRSHLKSKGSYIDPDLYVSIFEKLYNINIIILKMDKTSPDGDISFPRYTNVYLSKNLKEDIPTVVIIKHEILTDWPYQCEIIVKHQKNIEYVFDTSDPFIKAVSKIKNEMNTVYLTSASGAYKKYKPVDY